MDTVTMNFVVCQWIRLRLPFCSPGFESQANHYLPTPFQFVVELLWCEKNENKNKKRPGLAQFFEIKMFLFQEHDAQTNGLLRRKVGRKILVFRGSQERRTSTTSVVASSHHVVRLGGRLRRVERSKRRRSESACQVWNVIFEMSYFAEVVTSLHKFY